MVGTLDLSEAVMEEGNTINGFQYCAPSSITQGQVADIVVLWLEQNPSLRHYSVATVVIAAMSQAYPC